MCDDIFDETIDDETLADKSWKKTTQQMNTAGYREGLDVGKEEMLQEGFNKAFSCSAQTLYKLAELRGKINGRLSYSLLRNGSLSKDRESKLQELLVNVVGLESGLLEVSKVNLDHWLADPRTREITTADVRELTADVREATDVKPDSKPHDHQEVGDWLRNKDYSSSNEGGCCSNQGKCSSKINNGSPQKEDSASNASGGLVNQNNSSGGKDNCLNDEQDSPSEKLSEITDISNETETENKKSQDIPTSFGNAVGDDENRIDMHGRDVLNVLGNSDMYGRNVLNVLGNSDMYGRNVLGSGTVLEQLNSFTEQFNSI